jgi:acyl-CoA synthetase (AMP-forming)/AMP-acid ligase II
MVNFSCKGVSRCFSVSDTWGDGAVINIGELATKPAILAPHRPALIDPQRGISRSFGQLADRSEALARALTGPLGAGFHHRVAALSQNCIELFELYLACAKSGSLLFPLNWRFSASQVAQALTDAEPTVVFFESDLRSVIDEIRGEVPAAHWVEWSPGKDSDYEEVLARISADRADYWLPKPGSLLHEPYLAVSTGGTTGIPKSAVHTQNTYGACTIDYMAAARICETDAYLSLGQLFHVVGYMPLAYLAAGRPVVVANFDAEALLDIIVEEGISGFFAIATMLPRLINAAKRKGIDPSSIRQVEYGGAPTAEEVIREATEVFDADLLQAWGMTEFGPGTYLGPASHRRALAGERPELLRSCGKAALLSTVAILGDDGSPVPQDGKSMGEVCHRGPNNMISYWNKPGETADVLRDGWIHTGDGGAWDADGHIYIVDRLKSMIISGGENVFPAEVERALGNHPEIAEVVVVGVADREWGEVIKAVVVRAPGSQLESRDVSAFVEGELGSYKKPRIVEFVDELPMTPTGKVNRKLLSESGPRLT